MNRAPSPHDPWWADHQRDCGGSYTKVKEPDNYKMKGKGAPFNAIKGKGPQRSNGSGSVNRAKGQQEKGLSSKVVIINGIVQKKAPHAHQTTQTESESKFPGHGIRLDSCNTQDQRRPGHSNTAKSISGMDRSPGRPTSTQDERTALPLPNNHSKSPATATTRAPDSPKAGTKRPANRDIRDMFLHSGTSDGKKAKVTPSMSGTGVGPHQQAASEDGSCSLEHSHVSSRMVTHRDSPSGGQVAEGGAGSGVNVGAGASADPLIDLTLTDEGADEEVACPVCAVQVPKGAINEHLDQCLQ